MDAQGLTGEMNQEASSSAPGKTEGVVMDMQEYLKKRGNRSRFPTRSFWEPDWTHESTLSKPVQVCNANGVGNCLSIWGGLEMMTESVTVQLPRETLQCFRLGAGAAGKSLEQFLTDRLIDPVRICCRWRGAEIPSLRTLEGSR